MKVTMPPSFVERQAALMRKSERSAKRILDSCGGKNLVEECEGFRRVKTVDGNETTREVSTIYDGFAQQSSMNQAGIVIKRTIVKLTDIGLEEILHYFSPSKGSTTVIKLNGKPVRVETPNK